MIDPSNITDFKLKKAQLQEMIIFWILVAGKNAKTTARLLENFLQHLYKTLGKNDPFSVIREFDTQNPDSGLEDLLKLCGFGCQKAKAKSLRDLIDKDLDLRTCTVKQLESVYGIGPKTARCFVMHTRPNVRYAGLDTHVLKWLKSLGHQVPNSTPSGKLYTKLENIFLELCDKLNMDVAKLDLAIWNAYSSGGELKLETLT